MGMSGLMNVPFPLLRFCCREIAEAQYLGLFQCIDLSKDFFYSYTYDLTNSLQHNMTAATSKTFPPPPFKVSIL